MHTHTYEKPQLLLLRAWFKTSKLLYLLKWALRDSNPEPTDYESVQSWTECLCFTAKLRHIWEFTRKIMGTMSLTLPLMVRGLESPLEQKISKKQRQRLRL